MVINKTTKKRLRAGTLRYEEGKGGLQRVVEKAPELIMFDEDIAKFTDRQLEAVHLLDRQFIPDCSLPVIKFLLYGGALGGGKDLALDTLIPTPVGWTTMGEIKVGDCVFDEKGVPCVVVGTTGILSNPCYLVRFSDGSEIVAGEDHEWVTETHSNRVNNVRRSNNFRQHRREIRKKYGTGKRPDLSKRNSQKVQSYLEREIPIPKTTKDISETIRDGVQTNHAIINALPLQLPYANLLIDPYVLGCWLGDGTSSLGDVTGADDEIFDHIRGAGYVVTDRASIFGHGVKGLKVKLREIGVLCNKHIPISYLRSSVDQRIALLQGLMDTDGYCDTRGQCEIQLTRKELAEGVYELLCSLGIKTQKREGTAKINGKDCGAKHRLKFITDIQVFRLQRKNSRQKRGDFRGTHIRRYVESITSVPTVPTRCIQVNSPSHQYLCGLAMIPTHNSYFLRWVLIRLLMSWYKLKGLSHVQVMLACEDFPSLKDRQLSKISREFPAWLGRMYSDHANYGRCFILDNTWGSGILCFRNLDDASKYQSAEFAAIAIDELTKNDIETFTFLRMRLRWPGLEDKECPFIGATNPGGIGHNYCKALWMDNDFPAEFIKPVDYRSMFAYVPSKAEDNPHLPASYWQGLETLPPHLKSAFKDGSWDVFVGQAFQEWSRTYHVIESPTPKPEQWKDGPWLVPEGRPIYMTFDWGFGKPFSVGWWWIDSDGRKYRFNEWYGWNGNQDQGIRLTDSEIAEGIIKRENSMGYNAVYGDSPKIINSQITRLCDPTCFNKKPDYRGGGQGPSTAEIFMNMGLQMGPGDPSRVLKWRQFHEHLRVPRDEEGKVNGIPMVQVYSSCQHFIRTVPGLMVDPNNIEDVDTNGEDHCADEAALLFMRRPVTQIIEKHEKTRPPGIEEVARLEREEIWAEIRRTEEMEVVLW